MGGEQNGILSILEKHGRDGGLGKGPARGDEDAEAEYTAFAKGRIGVHPQMSIIFRKADGSAKGFAYAHLYSVESNNPAAGFIAEFTQTKVTVSGRNLEPLFAYLCQHRAAEVREAERNQLFEMAGDEPVVESIAFRSLE